MYYEKEGLGQYIYGITVKNTIYYPVPSLEKAVRLAQIMMIELIISFLVSKIIPTAMTV